MSPAKLNIQHFVCQIRDGRLTPIRLDGEPRNLFGLPATQKERLYVVKCGGKFCYVGVTRQSMTSRMRQHLDRWNGLSKVNLYVYATELNTKGAETIEAELVFLIRKKTGKWPTHQTEIHFHNLMRIPNKTHRETAENLFGRLRKLR